MLPYVFASCLNLVLNYLLIPELGINGAALASVISTVVLASIHYNLSRVAFFVPIDWPKISLILLCCIGCVVLVEIYEIQYFWVVFFAKILMLGAFCAYLLRMEELKFFIKLKTNT